MYFSDQFLDEVMARNDLPDVVGEYVRLTPKGASLWGCCPFHSEKTPSFHIIGPENIYYKCFGCGAGGGVINFIMEIEHLGFQDAVLFLAKRARMRIPEDSGGGTKNAKIQKRCIEANTAAARFYHECLKGPKGGAVREYIAQRRISPRYVIRFGLGCASEEWNALQTALTAQGFSKKELLDAGLCVVGKNGKIYDKFQNRLMLPVIDIKGSVVGFTSRLLPGLEGAKYLNSPDTACFKKSRLIYGLNYAKNSKRPNLILVEGNIDVITLHQAGFDNVVATMGTALTEGHAKVLEGFRKELVICYDNDAAGKESTSRALGILRNVAVPVRVLQLPNAAGPDGTPLKQDPDDFIKRYGAAAFEKCLDGSVGQNDYKIETLLQAHDLKNEEGRMAFLKAAVETVGKLENAIEREVYGNKAATAAGITGAAFAQEVDRWRRDTSRRERRKELHRELVPAAALQPRERSLRYTDIRSGRAEEGLIRLALLEPAFLDRAEVEPEEFSSPLYGKAFRLLRDQRRQGRNVQLVTLTGEFTPEEMAQLAGIAGQPASADHGAQAMKDYIRIIRAGAEERQAARSADALMALRARQRETKAMEDGQ